MNNNRRKELNELAMNLRKALESLKNVEIEIDSIKTSVEGVQFDEEWYHDNIPENLQNSERAAISEEALDHIEDALSSLEDGLESIGEAIASIEAATA